MATSDGLYYATPLQLAAILGIKSDVPSWKDSTTPTATKEEVGTGDGSNTEFYLDKKNVIPDTCTLYYGSDQTTTDQLTETTHYTLAKDTGKITLTSAGVTLVSTNKIFAVYSYFLKDLRSSMIVDALLRAEKEVDNTLNTTFRDGTETNPSFIGNTEIHESQGRFNRRYQLHKRPLIDITSSLDGDITSSDVSLDVASGDGASFPSTGTILIGSEIITYTGVSTDTLTGLTRGVGGSTAAAHSDGDAIHTTCVESSSTPQGNTVTWKSLAWGTEFYADSDLSVIHINDVTIIAGTYADNAVYPAAGVANRLRVRYLSGWDSVPVDITRLTLIFAKRMLIRDNLSRSLIFGRDEFNPNLYNADKEEIDRIVGTYREIPMANT